MSNNPESIIYHPLNVSSSKQAFSFSRSNRFFSKRQSSTEKLYTLPSTLQKKTCTFGYGSKTSFEIKQSSPPPGSYKSFSDFSQDKKPNTVSFGSGREEVKFGSFLLDSERKKSIPPPNSYNISNSRSSKYGRMAIRLPTEIEILSKRKSPGPGTYNVESTEIGNSKGSYALAKFKNSIAPKFHSPLLSPKSKSKQKKVGPGQYDLTKLNVLSKFKNSGPGKFAKAARQGLQDKTKINLPGFKYHRFSQFSGNDQ